MKLIAPIIFAASTAAFDIDMEHEDQLVRVRRQSNGFGGNDADLSSIFAAGLGNRLRFPASNNGMVAGATAEEAAAALVEDASDSDGAFECVYVSPDGFSFYWSSIDTEEECRAEKDVVFEAECENVLCGDDEAWDCSPDGIQACVQAQYMAGRNGGGRKLGVKYTRWKAVAKIIGHQVAKPTLRKKDVIKKMLNYGCHCFPGSRKSRSVGGKGPAMDEIDGVCRSQYQCHKCVEMDHGCDPDQTPYKVQFKGKKGQLAGKQIICRDEENTCARNMCECDKRMAENLDKIWFKEGAHNPFYWLDRKNVRKAKKAGTELFDYEGTCFTGQNSPSPDMCCGNFPDVVPFNAATKECCVVTEGPKLFDPLTHTCCSGGLIATAGSC